MDRISAFMDGETRPRETEQAIRHLRQHQEHLESWHTFHLIGDAMRGDPMLRNDFTTRLRSRLQQEPTVLAPLFHWRKPLNLALSAVASLAAVAVILTLVTLENPLQPLAPVAVAPRPAMTEGARAAAPPQPAATANQGRMNEYLMAHQEFSPSTALQGVAPYVRTVSVARGADGR
ncbi:MAG: sigma-E factor negative regulatory protein [Betaproteobacteria bacterium]|nr:sigma-E factor negative regulatory protein [Betaproteobacteria bacterium]